jgi:hypothetical protein
MQCNAMQCNRLTTKEQGAKSEPHTHTHTKRCGKVQTHIIKTVPRALLHEKKKAANQNKG